MRRIISSFSTVLFLLCLILTPASFAAETAKPASEATSLANEEAYRNLPFSDTQDFEDARRGFIATVPGGQIKSGDKVIWDINKYSFLTSTDKIPPSVHPSLWRIGQLNYSAGLFKVTDRIYQYRGFDVAVMTIIEGNKGVIIIDPLVSADSARTGLDLYYDNVPTGKDKSGKKRPVVAVLYTHPHGDHFGGVRGVLSGDPEQDRKVKILAPEGFVEHAISENVYAGNIMGRRSSYMYGRLIPPGPLGGVGCGLANTTTSTKIGIVAPNDTIKKTDEKRVIDGVEMVFELANDTEAPVEFVIYFPQFKAICGADLTIPTLHNLLTPRGAEIRDSAKWWEAVDSMINKYGEKTDLIFGSHGWPRWGHDHVISFLEGQRDVYKYLHDQTLRLANLGYTPTEIAEQIKLPKALDQLWHTRGTYGSITFNVKAIYQFYLGWFDGNPTNLNRLTPVEEGKRYVEFMGGAAEVLKKAKPYFDKGDYRWVATVLTNVVFADPENQEAKNMLADTYEQLGYQSESGPWRNFYLTGASDLRNGRPNLGKPTMITPDMMRSMSASMALDYIAERLNPEKSAGKAIALRWIQPDTKERYDIVLKNDLLIYRKDMKLPKVDATIIAEKANFIELFSTLRPFEEKIADNSLKIEGDPAVVQALLNMLDQFDMNINIVTP